MDILASETLAPEKWLAVELIEEKIVGLSVQNKPILLRLYNCKQATQMDTLFIGSFHGDEGISTLLLEKWHMELKFLANDMLETYPPFGILLALNPDGLARESRVNARGVDLNRNYPTKDWAELNKGEPYYSGMSAASEPETQTMMSVLKVARPRKIVSIHSPYKVINYDGPARPLAEAMSVHNGYPVVDSIGYDTPGSFGTYAGKELGIPTITLELPEDEPLEKVWTENRMALIEATRFQV
jgi:murein peptide amidase A